MILALLKFLLQVTIYLSGTFLLLVFFSYLFAKRNAGPEKPPEKKKIRKSKKVLEESSGTIEPEVTVRRHNNYIPRGDIMKNVFLNELGKGFTLKSNRVRNTHEKQSVYRKKNSYIE